jgi:hypothetical protein
MINALINGILMKVAGPGPEEQWQSPPPEPIGGSEIINPVIMADVILGLLNIILLLVLIYIYWNSYRKIKSKFTTGLLIFALLLLLQNVLFTAYFIIYSGFRGPGMGLPILTLNLTEFVALFTLVIITWE